MADHVCPPWIGYFMASPIRKLFQHPTKILSPYVRPGMTALDIGCAMGFFSVPLAELVGPTGRVVCLDVQERMLKSLQKRVRKAGVAGRVESRLVPKDGLGCGDLRGAVDFTLAFAMVHEVPDQRQFLADVYDCLVPGGKLLVSEPRGHVTEKKFEETLRTAQEAGFSIVDRPRIRGDHSAVLVKAAN